VLNLVRWLGRQLRRVRKERHDESNCCGDPKGETEHCAAIGHGSVVMAPPLDGEGLGWGDVPAREAAMFTPTLPSPIKGEGESLSR